MSGHDHERLSAYHDGELEAADRAAVEAHVGACPECAAELLALEAVDEAARGLEPQAPAGYFETLPGRVRARLEPGAAAQRPARLPGWTWAVAAALVLAVITPLTLRRAPESAAPPLQSDLERPAAEPADAAGRAAERPLSASPAPPAAAPVPTTAPASPPRAQPAELRERDALRDGTRGSARAPSAPAERRETRESGAGFAAEPSAAPPSRTLEAPGAAAPPQAQERLADSLAAPAPYAQAPAPAPAAPAKPPEEAAAAGLAGSSAGRNQARAYDEAKAKRGRVDGPAQELAWQRLDATRPRTLAEWRRLRDGWRGFVARDPTGPLADEARVRTIEAGRGAWLAGGEPADETLFRGDAAAYLERDDAAQKERVRRLVE